MTHWGMVIDLRKCIGCETCKHVCNDVNYTGWRRVIDLMMENNPKEKKVFISMGCMHCIEPPCLEVCPTGATRHRSDGIVKIDQTLCVGCGACILACPYKARQINSEDRISNQKNHGQDNSVREHSDRIGICSKCDFCASRLDEGVKKGLQPGQDFEATPICVRHCIAEALHFGDLDDPESNVSRLIRENKTERLNESLGTDPSVFYILE
jgi:phenylacetyl-CoA:acceptor oxidoreductase 27-kDa subunit